MAWNFWVNYGFRIAGLKSKAISNSSKAVKFCHGARTPPTKSKNDRFSRGVTILGF